MGFDLYRMLRAGMPPEWSQGERLVALIIADACSDRTGMGYIPNQQLCAETGYTPRSLSDVLLRLSKRGSEMRIPHGEGKDGRPVFAARGHGTEYVVPVLKPRSSPGLSKGRSSPGLSKGPVLTAKGPVLTGDSPGPHRPPTPVHPPNPNKHDAPVVTTSVEGSDVGSASRLPIESEAWNAIQMKEAANA